MSRPCNAACGDDPDAYIGGRYSRDEEKSDGLLRLGASFDQFRGYRRFLVDHLCPCGENVEFTIGPHFGDRLYRPLGWQSSKKQGTSFG